MKVLGSGSYGKVFMSYNIHNPDLKVAIKVMDKEKLQFNMQNIIDEVAILIKLDHPNIVKYYETYNDNKFIYLVQEYIAGKQLFQYITSQPESRFSEKQACLYFK